MQAVKAIELQNSLNFVIILYELRLGGGMADAAVSKTVGLITRVGSTPTPGMPM